MLPLKTPAPPPFFATALRTDRSLQTPWPALYHICAAARELCHQYRQMRWRARRFPRAYHPLDLGWRLERPGTAYAMRGKDCRHRRQHEFPLKIFSSSLATFLVDEFDEGLGVSFRASS